MEISEDLTTNVEERAPNEKQMFNEPVCGVIDIHQELNRQGDLEQTHIPSAAQSCQKELKNVEAEVGESGHSLGSLESRVEDSLGFEVSGNTDGPLSHPGNEAVEDTLGSNLGPNIIPRAVEDNEYDSG